MFNLFVSWEENAFDSQAWVLDRGRFGEWTAETLLERFRASTPPAKRKLKSIPSLFFTEMLRGEAHIGFIRSIRERERDRQLLVDFAFDPRYPAFPAALLSTRVLTRLDIAGGELSRTHWAVKDENLLRVLESEGVLLNTSQPDVRSTISPTVNPIPVLTSPASRPKAFISYSWDDEPHKEWVLRLATRLRTDGVDVVLDRWHLRLGADKLHFMETSVSQSDRVLLIGSPTFATRANNRSGGVGWEASIVTGELADDLTQTKFVPVLKTGEWNTSLPHWLRPRLGVDLRGDPYSEEQYGLLLRELHEARETAPPVGSRPSFS